MEYVWHCGDLYSGPLFCSTFDLAGYTRKCMINISVFLLPSVLCVYTCVSREMKKRRHMVAQSEADV